MNINLILLYLTGIDLMVKKDKEPYWIVKFWKERVIEKEKVTNKRIKKKCTGLKDTKDWRISSWIHFRVHWSDAAVKCWKSVYCIFHTWHCQTLYLSYDFEFFDFIADNLNMLWLYWNPWWWLRNLDEYKIKIVLIKFK